MVIRAGLFLGGLAAALTVAAALAFGSLAPGTTPVAAAPATNSGASVPSPTATIQVDTVYIPAPVPPQTVIVQRQTPPGGEHENESESGGADD